MSLVQEHSAQPSFRLDLEGHVRHGWEAGKQGEINLLRLSEHAKERGVSMITTTFYDKEFLVPAECVIRIVIESASRPLCRQQDRLRLSIFVKFGNRHRSRWTKWPISRGRTVRIVGII